jgi:hypothetical protein
MRKNSNTDALRSNPKTLVVSALPYMFSAKLVLSLEQVGFSVAVVCPSRHPVHHLRRPPKRYPLGVAGANSLGPLGAKGRVKAAIEHYGPATVIACDDHAVRILHRIGSAASGSLRNLLEISLGPVGAYPVLESRTAQVQLAHRLNIRTPLFKIVDTQHSLARALEEIRPPAFIKRDDSWAGLGVRKVTDSSTAFKAWRELSNQHSLLQAFKNVRSMGLRHALAGVRNVLPGIHLQAAVTGRPANHAVLCRNGEVIGGLTVLALETSSTTGPASVLRAIDNPEMSAMAGRLVKELRLNGFAGFDFLLGDNGEPYFLEINARATPAVTLALAGKPDLLDLLFKTIAHSSNAPNRYVAADTVALFPDEILRDEASPFLRTAYHDMPVDEPGLVDFGLAQVRSKGNPM